MRRIGPVIVFLLAAVGTPAFGQTSCGVRPDIASGTLVQAIDGEAKSLLGRTLPEDKAGETITPALRALAHRFETQAESADRPKVRAYLFNTLCFAILTGQAAWKGDRAAHIRQVRAALHDDVPKEQTISEMAGGGTTQPEAPATDSAGASRDGKLEARLGAGAGSTNSDAEASEADWKARILGRLKRVKMTLSHPETMTVGGEGPVLLVLEADRTARLPDAQEFRLGHGLRATLEAPDFDIAPAAAQNKVLSVDRPQQWGWTIRARKAGAARPLTVKLEVLPSSKSARPVLVKTLKRTLPVQAGWASRLYDTFKSWMD